MAEDVSRILDHPLSRVMTAKRVVTAKV